jgi:hypothetical protein
VPDATGNLLPLKLSDAAKLASLKFAAEQNALSQNLHTRPILAHRLVMRLSIAA